MFFASVPDPVVDKPPEADAWYKSALEKARQIAQSMKEGGPPPAQPDNNDAVAIKTEPEVKPLKVEQESVPAEKDEYGNGSTVNPAPSSSSASLPTPSVPATSTNYFSFFLRERIHSA